MIRPVRIIAKTLLENADEITIAGKKWKEVTNFQYELTASDIEEFCELPSMFPKTISDQEERDQIIKYFEDYNFEDDLYTRQACIQPKYENELHKAACLSVLQILIRKSGIELHIFVRSQNFETNFLYDNQTYAMIMKNLSRKTGKKVFKAFIKITSLHIEIY